MKTSANMPCSLVEHTPVATAADALMPLPLPGSNARIGVSVLAGGSVAHITTPEEAAAAAEPLRSEPRAPPAPEDEQANGQHHGGNDEVDALLQRSDYAVACGAQSVLLCVTQCFALRAPPKSSFGATRKRVQNESD